MGKDKEKSKKDKKEKTKENSKYWRAQYDALKKERDEIQCKLSEYVDHTTVLSSELEKRNRTIDDLRAENKSYKRRLTICKYLAVAAAILAAILIYAFLA